jgi:hypothetical protein
MIAHADLTSAEPNKVLLMRVALTDWPICQEVWMRIFCHGFLFAFVLNYFL